MTFFCSFIFVLISKSKYFAEKLEIINKDNENMSCDECVMDFHPNKAMSHQICAMQSEKNHVSELDQQMLEPFYFCMR